jgi:hypothetical protein
MTDAGSEAWQAAARPFRRGVRACALAVAGIIGMGNVCGAAEPDWDQAANIKDAATRLAQIQRTQGATKAFQFIDACYRTHRLSSTYTKAFEACIAQDYLETQILTLIYGRLSPDTLKRMGAPTPQVLTATMLQRVGSSFAQYNVSKERIAEFKKNIDEHGFPLFFKTLFPDAKMPVPNLGPGPGDKPPGEPPPAAKPDTAPADNKSPEQKSPEKP